MPDDATPTRTIKAALKRAFPRCKFSVTCGGSQIEWTDDGPEVSVVEDVIIGTGLVEIRQSFDNKRWLGLHHGSISFNRYNAVRRAAYQDDLERRRIEERGRAERVNAAMTAAVRTKRQAIDVLRHNAPQPDTSQLQEVTQAFETLRERAEVAVAIEKDRQRRPTWAPPLTLDGELLQLCRALDYLTPDDPPIARLWASYADPKRSGRSLRDAFSEVPLSGIACRGFQLFAGSERGNTGDLLFEAQRTRTGAWRFGPTLYMSAYYGPRSGEWERLTRDRLEIEDRIAQGHSSPGDQARGAEFTRRIAEIDAQDLANAGKQRMSSEQRTRTVQLAQQRVLDFVGAPDAQMQLAARLCGHCCRCFMELTDPLSLERGIGPDCYDKLIKFIRAYSTEDVDWLVMMTGLPREFVDEIITKMPQPQLELDQTKETS